MTMADSDSLRFPDARLIRRHHELSCPSRGAIPEAKS